VDRDGGEGAEPVATAEEWPVDRVIPWTGMLGW